MCAFNDPDELRKLRKQTKPIRAWKVLQGSGRSTGRNICYWIGSSYYGPGHTVAKHVTRATTYDSDDPTGLHIYRTKKTAAYVTFGRSYRAVPVYIDPKDLIAAEAASDPDSQLVACRLTIRPEDWEAAGFPKRVTRRRYV